jgi:hypothetical protein
MDCVWGAPTRRGRVTDFSPFPADVKHRYTKSGAVMGFILAAEF